MFWIQVTTRLLFFQPLLCGHRHRHDQRLPKLAVGDATVYEWTKLPLEILRTDSHNPRQKVSQVYGIIYQSSEKSVQCGQASVYFCGVGGWTNFTWGASGRFVTGWVTWAGILHDESCTCRRDVAHLIESLEFLSTCTIQEGRANFSCGKIVFWGIPCIGRILFVKFRRGKTPPHEQKFTGSDISSQIKSTSFKKATEDLGHVRISLDYMLLTWSSNDASNGTVNWFSDSHLFMFSHGYAGLSYPFIAHSRSWTPISAREARHPPSPTKFLSLKAIPSLRPSSLCQPFRHLLARSTIVTQREVQRACARVSIQLLGPVT